MPEVEPTWHESATKVVGEKFKLLQEFTFTLEGEGCSGATVYAFTPGVPVSTSPRYIGLDGVTYLSSGIPGSVISKYPISETIEDTRSKP